MEKLGIPKLTYKQAEKICEIGERAAREDVLSKVPLNRIYDISVTVDTKSLKQVQVSVDLEIVLSPLMTDLDVQKLVNEARDKAFLAIEKHLRKIACKSRK